MTSKRWRTGERETIGAPQQDRIRALAVTAGDELRRGELDRGDMKPVVGVGKSVDIGCESGGGHCYPKVVQDRAAGYQGLAA